MPGWLPVMYGSADPTKKAGSCLDGVNPRGFSGRARPGGRVTLWPVARLALQDCGYGGPLAPAGRQDGGQAQPGSGHRAAGRRRRVEGAGAPLVLDHEQHVLDLAAPSHPVEVDGDIDGAPGHAPASRRAAPASGWRGCSACPSGRRAPTGSYPAAASPTEAAAGTFIATPPGGHAC